MPLDRPPPPFRTQLINDLVERLVQRDLCHVLPIVGSRDRPPEPQLAGCRWVFAHQGLEKSRFAGPIRTNQSKNVGTSDMAGKAVDQVAPANLDGSLLRDDYLI